MNLKRLELFRREFADFKKENIASCILSRRYQHLEIGSPGMAFINPFRIHERRKGVSHTSPPPRGYGYINGRDVFSEKKEEEKYYSMSEAVLKYPEESKLNEVLRANLSNISFVSVFIPWRDSIDYYTTSIHTSDAYVTHKTPIIWDDSASYVNINRLGDHFGKAELKSLPEVLNEKLKTHRYLVYTFKNITSVKKAEAAVRAANTLLGPLYKMRSTCFSYLMDTRPRAAFGEMSISFYKLSDVVPIFDVTSSKFGVAVDLSVLSEAAEPGQLYSGYRYMSVKSIFSPSKENIFTIDGEKIVRECSTDSKETNGKLLKKLTSYCHKQKSDTKKKSATATAGHNMDELEEMARLAKRERDKATFGAFLEVD
jgi:hypothetical protein